ncbi:ABC transporter permease [Bosea minatitlanensis]|uniref:ABC transporter permease n=1 Tax=Bosea minatitlanensis TaxID=128782 RepID=A0ABW0F2A2_9HYPH|nr:ABC transporter permease [Bosea minatitlanensis]MCT4495245.1 ABC transporter permease [Bosea minatitlanensis]
MTSADIATPRLAFSRTKRHWLLRGAQRHVTVVIGGMLITLLVGTALLAPVLATHDPLALNVAHRLRAPSAEHWFGTDNLGRDVFSRTVYGGRISLLVGLGVAALTTLIGSVLGLLAGMYRWFDSVIMRIMDGLMAIPAILLAVAMMALARPGLLTVVIAITVPEVPRMVRLVRSVVLVIRELPYVEAATAIGARMPRLLLRHILPNALTPIIIQATYVCASAVLIESYLGFLGVGIPPEIPSWGNILSDGRSYVQLAFWIIFFPGMFLGFMVLAINMLGDGLRDMLDPRLARRF